MEIKTRIKQKADELFMRYGIKSITMDEIASQLGISKKTIYQEFGDKDELVDEVITDILAENQRRCLQDRSVATNAVHEVFLAMEMIQEMFEDMNPTILYDMERNHPATFQKFQQHKHKFLFQVIRDNIERGKKEELFRENVNSDVVAKVRMEIMMLPFNQDLFPKNRFNLVDLHTQVCEYYLFGISTIKGYKLINKYQFERTKKMNQNEKSQA
ncbi:MAG: TetR/AcrR family transcriptional regulator [Ginsengibacter sp.]